ncbi:MAG TPA: AMP-binding protein, partial [Pyrinomonadaceae bacterium]|nr:AMP-binding protein [Pyrinomonadaceae bacterium]
MSPNLTRSTLVELLRWRAEHQADQLAHTFLPDGDAIEKTLTYAQVDREARRIAARLQSIDAKGERVLLLYPPGLEFISAFFGCLYAGAIAVPVYPPRRNRNLLRLMAIVMDCESSIVMTTGATLSKVQPWFADTPQLKNMRLVASDSLEDQSEHDWREPVVDKNSLAFLQYTSGSTGRPKGVMLTHENLLFNAALVYSAVDHAPGDKYVSWLPTFHDMGFMAGILQPLYGGFQSVLMSPAAFLQRPLSWLEAITRYRATTSGAPNFAYELCVRKINAEQKATLDLSSWTVAFNGAEPIRLEALERFVEAFEPCGFRREAFYPCYGLAEATLMVSGSLKTGAPLSKRVDAKALMDHRVVESGENVRLLVGCGRNLGSQKIVLVQPDTCVECAPGEVGEIWVAGTSVAQGYWRKPELTEQTFHARLAGTGEGPFLRTGDLGFMDDGELFVTGRLKDLVIIRGFNHYPQDIELTVEKCHRALRPGCGAAFAVEAGGEERLVVVYEVDERQEVELNDLRERVISAIAEEHELQTYAVVFIRQGSVPKTSSGKIQRHACQTGFLEQKLDVVAEWRQDLTTDQSPVPLQEIGDVGDWLKQEIARALKLPAGQLDLEKPLAQYGLDSLAALELIYGIEVATGASLSVASFLQDCSISDLAAEIRGQLNGFGVDSTLPAEDIREDELSRGQQALWFLHRLAPESAAYNISGAVRLLGEVGTDALRESFQALVDRHASLRTTYYEQDGRPLQHVHDHIEVCFHAEDASSWTGAALDERLAQDARIPFNLETGPLLRVSLFSRSANEHVLLLVVHHIAVDFWSLAVLVHELGLLYQAQTPLDALPLQYSDYVRRQEQMLRSPEGDRLWAYWQKQLAGDLPVIDLPTDRPRPSVQTFNGASHAFKLDPSLTQQLKA